MATSSIFRVPQFSTEESARSLLEAIETTMSDTTDYRRSPAKPDAEQLKIKEEIKRFFGVAE